MKELKQLATNISNNYKLCNNFSTKYNKILPHDSTRFNELERMIKNSCIYEEVIEESKCIDEYIKEQIEEAI